MQIKQRSYKSFTNLADDEVVERNVLVKVNIQVLAERTSQLNNHSKLKKIYIMYIICAVEIHKMYMIKPTYVLQLWRVRSNRALDL